MSGALVGFRVNGVNKLTRLHGERSCEHVLAEVLAYLHGTSNDRLLAYARVLKLVHLEDGPYPSSSASELVTSFFEAHLGESCAMRDWAQVFENLPGMEAWHAGFPFMLGATLGTCGDVSWGFLINLDAGQLQIFVNRTSHFQWRDLECWQPYCSLPLEHARQLDPADARALHEVLHAHSYGDGLDPALPARDGVSDSFPGPGCFQARVRVANGRVRLLLSRGELQVEVSQMGELRLDHAGYGAFLCQSIETRVLHLAQAIYGPALTLTQAACVAGHMAQLPFAPADRGLPLLDLGLRSSCALGLVLGPAYFDGLKARLLTAGMSNQGWRFLIKQADPVLRFVLQFFPPSGRNLKEFAHFINLLASALQDQPLLLERCQPGLRGVERILERGMGKISAMREENARIFLRAIMRARLTPEEAANLGHEAQDVSDFMYAQTRELPGNMVTWQSLCRRSTDWHRAAMISIEPERDVRWPALLPSITIGEQLAIELCTGALLAEEGLEQKHCVGNYANACASGSCRVFSLRRHGKRVATVELRREAVRETAREARGFWCLAQVRGKANSVITDENVLAAAAQVATAYSQAAQAAALARAAAIQKAAAQRAAEKSAAEKIAPYPLPPGASQAAQGAAPLS